MEVIERRIVEMDKSSPQDLDRVVCKFFIEVARLMEKSTSWILSLVSKQASKDNSVMLGQNQQNLKSQEKN